MNITISKLEIEEWPKYKELRLEALVNEPTSFGSSYEDNIENTDEFWENLLQKSHDENGNIMFFAKDGDKLVGMIGAYWDDKEKTKHIATIIAVYVKKEYRGRGIGSMLMQALLNDLNNIAQIEKFELGVVTEHIPALKLYEKFGFEIIGKEQKALKVEGKYYDEYIMEKLK